MIAGLASLVFIPLLALFFAHVLWALGSTWPVGDRPTLARTIVGGSDNERNFSRWRAAGTALFVGFAGLVALSLTDTGPSAGLTALGAVLTAIFAVRGALTYHPWWRQRHAAEPFAQFDRRVYGPLSLFIAIGLALLTIWRLT